MKKIFVSYSAKDSETVQKICKDLDNNRFKILPEPNILTDGEDFAIFITQQIEQADLVLFFYSKNSADSIWVRREVEYALSKEKRIIPVLLSRFVENEWFRTRFSSISSVIIDEESTDRNIADITAAITSSQPVVAPEQERQNLSPQNKQPYHSASKRRGKGGCILIVCITLVLSASLAYWLLNLWTVEKSMEQPTTDNEIYSYSKPTDENDTTTEDSSRSTESNWKLTTIIASFILGCGCTLAFMGLKRNRKNLKVSSDTASRISIDGKLKSEISARGFYSTHLDKGEYLIDFEDKNNSERHLTFNHSVDSGKCKLLYAEFEKETDTEKTIKCFIAGSKALQHERDALRAVTSIMYNKWASKKFRILSYTFEDFERAVVIGGQQQKYNEFITEEANWALFIINGQVGGFTIEEYRKAMNTYKCKGRPKILIMAQSGSENNENVAEIKREIDKEQQYWNDYNDINEMKHIFESTLNWDLIEMFHS